MPLLYNLLDDTEQVEPALNQFDDESESVLNYGNIDGKVQSKQSLLFVSDDQELCMNARVVLCPALACERLDKFAIDTFVGASLAPIPKCLPSDDVVEST